MTEPNYMFWIEAKGKGLFSCPEFAPDFELPESYGPDLACAFALDRAKGGDFGLIPSVVDLYQASGSQQIDSMIIGTIAYAGPASCFSGIVDVVKHNNDLRIVLDYCGVMVVRGELSYVPIFLDKYLANQNDRDAVYMIDYISRLSGDVVSHIFNDLIVDGLFPDDPEEFRDRVFECYRQMVQRLGSEKALVFGGQLYSVVRLAKCILETVRQPHFQSYLRRRFEAATGIDCSSWYKNQSLQPLAVTAMIEEFLESPEAATYEDGVRYFFGHRIPD